MGRPDSEMQVTTPPLVGAERSPLFLRLLAFFGASLLESSGKPARLVQLCLKVSGFNNFEGSDDIPTSARGVDACNSQPDCTF